MNTIKRPVPTGLLAWLAMLGFDFFLHGGLLAHFYVAGDPVLLSPLEAFQRIPLGYAAFLLFAVLLVWLIPRFELPNWQAAFGFGLKLGALMWGAFVLGLISIVRFDVGLALAWFVGQALEFGLGAAVVQKAAAASSLRGITLRVLAFVLVAIIITVILQSTGFAPAVRFVP